MDDKEHAVEGLRVVSAGTAALAAMIEDGKLGDDLIETLLKTLVLVLRTVAYDLGLTTRP